MTLNNLKLKIEAGLADEDWGAIKSALNDLEVIIEKELEYMKPHEEVRPDNAEPGIVHGAMFYCPSCKVTTCDAWVTYPEIGSSVKCPSCKQGFEVISLPNESNLMQVRKKPKRFIQELEESAEPISLWFGLTYAQYLTVPRLIMQSMSVRWQRKMAVLLQEMDETFDWRPKEACYWVKLKDNAGRFVHAPLEDYRRGSCEHLRRIND